MGESWSAAVVRGGAVPVVLNDWWKSVAPTMSPSSIDTGATSQTYEP